MNGNGIVGGNLPYQNNTGLDSEKCIRGLVRLPLANRTKQSPRQITVNTPIPAEFEEAILEEVGRDIDRLIPKRRKARHGLKVSTIVGYIYAQQGSFPRRQ